MSSDIPCLGSPTLCFTIGARKLLSRSGEAQLLEAVRHHPVQHLQVADRDHLVQGRNASCVGFNS